MGIHESGSSDEDGQADEQCVLICQEGHDVLGHDQGHPELYCRFGIRLLGEVH